MKDSLSLRQLLRQTLEVLGTALGYFAVGWVAVCLAIPPGYASPLYPSAGIALAAVLVFGRWAAVGVAVGAFAVNLTLSHGAAPLAVPVFIGLGAALQSLVAAALVKRFVSQPLTLSEPRDIAAFYGFGGPIGCLVSATVGVATLGVAGIVLPGNLAFNWLNWWLGDTLGTLIAAPVVLTLIGRPREEWASRRLNVGLTLTIVTLLLAAMISRVTRWDEERLRDNFEREAQSATSALMVQLQEPLFALEALRDVYLASQDVTQSELRRASRSWLEGPGRLQAVGFSQRLSRAQIPAFEAQMRAEGLGTYRVFDRQDAQAGGASGDDVVAIRYIEPMAGNSQALGVNARSIPAARTAIDSAIRTDSPSATAGFVLTQDVRDADQIGVVVYHAVYQGEPKTVAERVGAARGVVFVTLRLEDTLRQVLDQVPHYLSVCVVDTDPLSPHRRLWGSMGCETQQASLLHVRAMPFAGRQWDLRIATNAQEMPGARDSNAWPFSLVALMSAAVLGALLLTVTGRARRIELAVRDRTAALTQQVHEREQAQAAMRVSEQRFRNIFNNVPIGIVYTDLQGNVKQANPRFCELVGYAPEELLHLTSAQLTQDEDLAQEEAYTARLIGGELPLLRWQKRLVAKGSHTVWVQTTVSLLRNEEGEPWRIVAAVEDITEHLRLQEAERAREAAEASNRAKSDFLSRMSHELRTPLNAMLGFAQLLELDRREPLPEGQRPWVMQIQQAGWHLLEMINDVLDLSRIESGNLRLDVESLELQPLVAAAVNMVQPEADKHRITIDQSLAAEASALHGDATRVKQILINLLSNAVKYNADGGRVQVTSRRIGEMIEVTVTDTGIGMTPEQLAGLFQPFNRLGRERSQHEGTGIGLVISQRLAELMGGSLHARSAAGEGSSFILCLPCVSGPQQTRSGADASSASPAAYHQRVVHYVEDNETNVEVMRGILAQRAQVVMEVSVTGLDALAAVRARAPDVILLDMHLPDISGLELLRHLKNDPATSGIPVIAVSADALMSQIEAALDAGAVHYLTKPVSVSELLAVLDELLEQAETRFG